MNKKSPSEDRQTQRKDRKKFRVNMPKKLGLISGKKYYFSETEKGYILILGRGLWIGMPKMLIENNPQLYSLRKGGNHGNH